MLIMLPVELTGQGVPEYSIRPVWAFLHFQISARADPAQTVTTQVSTSKRLFIS